MQLWNMAQSNWCFVLTSTNTVINTGSIFFKSSYVYIKYKLAHVILFSVMIMTTVLWCLPLILIFITLHSLKLCLNQPKKCDQCMNHCFSVFICIYKYKLLHLIHFFSHDNANTVDIFDSYWIYWHSHSDMKYGTVKLPFCLNKHQKSDQCMKFVSKHCLYI